MASEDTIQNVGNGTTDTDELQPLLSSSLKLPGPEGDSTKSPLSPSPEADIRIILPALMLCAFLAAFDVTVVAAIYPIMSARLPNAS